LKKKSFLFCLLIFQINSFSQSNHEWFPSNLNIQTFTANFLEAKTGFSYLINESELRLDIGASSDFLHIKKGNSTLSFGADFFTYTRLRGGKEFHFPVEAIDYFFGINSGYKIVEGEKEYGARLRFSHISAHFVDGHYDYVIDGWRDGKTPRVYSREFVDILPYYRINGFRGYIGLTYLFHVSPSYIGKGIYQVGFDYFLTPIANKIFTPFIAADLKFAKIIDYEGNLILSAGIKFGNFKEKGFSILFSYYSGKSVHGEYFDETENYLTVGFNLDL
jgi:hypothetical protein